MPPIRSLWWDGRAFHGHRSVALGPQGEDRAAEMLAAGMGCDEIAARLGCPLVTVAEVAFRRCIEPAWTDPEARARPEPRWYAEARRMAADGLTARQIAARTGLTVGRVYEWAKAHGVPVRVPTRARTILPDVQVRARALAETHTSGQVATELGVSRRALLKWAARRGVKFRGYLGSPEQAAQARANLVKARQARGLPA